MQYLFPDKESEGEKGIFCVFVKKSSRFKQIQVVVALYLLCMYDLRLFSSKKITPPFPPPAPLLGGQK